MKKNLNKAMKKEDISMEAVCGSVKNAVDKFVEDAPQFDDITMLAFRLK